jgi:hypothetical protein
MADNVLGSISIVITGDSSQLEAALSGSVASAQSSGAAISSSFQRAASGAAAAVVPLARASETFAQSYERILAQFHAGEIGAKQAEKAFANLRAEESACARTVIQLDTAQAAQAASQKALASLATVSAAAQRAATQEVRGTATAATQLGAASSQATYGIRYMIFGLKDIGEGRYRYALAELVNVLMRLGPVAIGVGAAIAVVGGGAYGIFKLNEHMRDLYVATQAAAQPFKELNDELLKSNDEMQVANDKLADELSKLQGHPGNGLKLALDEAVVAADDLNAALHRDIQALQELLEKKEISSAGGFLKFEVPTTDLKKKIEKFNIEIADATREGSAKIRDAALLGDKKSEDAARSALNSDLIRRYTQEIKTLTPEMENLRRAGMGGADVFERLDAILHKGVGALHTDVVPPSSVQAVMQYQQAIADLGNQMDAVSLRADHDKLKPQVEAAKLAKEGVNDARALAVAKIEAQQKALQEQTELAKRASEAQIESDHAVVQRQIAGMVDRKAAATAEAAEEVRVAQAKEAAITADHAANTRARIDAIKALGAAEKQGKTGTEQQTIGIKTDEKLAELDTSQKLAELDAARATAEKQTASAVKQITESRERDLEALKEIGKQLDENNARVELYRNLAIQLKEIREKGSGNEAELKATKEKLEAERAYATSAGHTYQQDIDYAVKIAAIEEKARQAKIAGVQAELATAQAAVNSPESTDEERANQAKIAARLQVQIRDLQAHADNANYEANTKILEKILAQNQALQAQKTILDALTNWSQISVGTAANQFAQTLVALPQQIGDSLARSIFTAPKKGQSKAGEIGEGLVKTTEKAGENLAGKLITDAIEKLVVQLVGQAAISSLQGSVTAANTAAIIANTAALTGEAAASGASGAAGGLGGIVGKLFGWIGGLVGFDTGGPVGSDMIAQVHRGEWVLNADQVSGRAPLPPQFIQNAGKSLGSSLVTNNHNTGTSGDSHFHIYGMNNPLQASRQIATFLKLKSPQFSPLNR